MLSESKDLPFQLLKLGKDAIKDICRYFFKGEFQGRAACFVLKNMLW
jgi:hypothetical protein